MATKKKSALSKKVIAGLSIGALFALMLGFQVIQSKSVGPSQITPTPTIVQILPSISVNSNVKCHLNGVLPDSTCTPGSSDPTVTQANIQQTICVSGYSGKVRPPVSYTNKLKAQQIAEYGFSDTNLHDYEEDHLISLELGGNPTDPKNLWPEPGGIPNSKDTVENRCHKKVCNGTISLSVAQQQIATNWQTACQ
jgi:hypothetical protein